MFNKLHRFSFHTHFTLISHGLLTVKYFYYFVLYIKIIYIFVFVTVNYKIRNFIKAFYLEAV